MSRSIPTRVLAAALAAWFVAATAVPAAVMHGGSPTASHARASCGHEQHQHPAAAVVAEYRCCTGLCCCAPAAVGTIPVVQPIFLRGAPSAGDLSPDVPYPHGRPSYRTPFATGPPLAPLV